jgi:hypothetical protein
MMEMMIVDVKRRLYYAILKMIVIMYALSMTSYNINAAVENSDVIITIVSQPEGCHDIGSRIVHKHESVRVHYTGTLLAYLTVYLSVYGHIHSSD